VTIKTTIALEFGNRKHRDEFLKRFQALLFTFGNKSPKVTITMSQKTEAEFGDPSSLDLFWCGVEAPAAVLTPLEMWEAALTAMERRYSVAGLEEASAAPKATQPADAGPDLEAAADASDAAREEAEVAAEVATDHPAGTMSLTERVLQTLATFGPLTIPALAMQLSEGAEVVEYELERLHLAGDVEPDDGGIWRLNDAE
jgi:hypothetical protein